MAYNSVLPYTLFCGYKRKNYLRFDMIMTNASHGKLEGLLKINSWFEYYIFNSHD